jgi:hypothetical protein
MDPAQSWELQPATTRAERDRWQELRSAMEALGYKDKNKMVYQMIENIQARVERFTPDLLYPYRVRRATPSRSKSSWT